MKSFLFLVALAPLIANADLTVENVQPLKGRLTKERYSKLSSGLNRIVFPDRNHNELESQPPLLLIVGINATGLAWSDGMDLLRQKGSRNVYLYKWNKSQAPQEISAGIARSLNYLQEKYGRDQDIQTLAHSAGGVMLLRALCESEDQEKCPYIQEAQNMNFYTVASPLGGYDYPFASKSAIFIGEFLAMMGSRIQFAPINRDVDLTLFMTTFESDHTMKKRNKYDIRIPSMDAPLRYKTQILEGSSHNGSALEALKIILEE